MWLRTSNRVERGLLYDLSQTGRAEARLQFKDGQWAVANESTEPLRSVLVAVPSESGEWSSAVLQALESSRPESRAKGKDKAAAQDAAKQAAEQAEAAKKVANSPAGKLVGQFLQAALGKNKPAGQKQPPPTTPKVNLTFDAVTLEPAESVAAIAEAYARGFDDLGQPERQFLIGSIVRACEENRAVVVYELSEESALKLTTLDISPSIGTIRRHAFVAAIDLDPRLTDTIDAQVAALGSDSWAERQQADELLRKLGQAAIPALRKAQKNKDAEVALRASRIVRDFEKATK